MWIKSDNIKCILSTLQGTSHSCGSPEEEVCSQGEEDGAANDGHGGQTCSPGRVTYYEIRNSKWKARGNQWVRNTRIFYCIMNIGKLHQDIFIPHTFQFFTKWPKITLVCEESDSA